MLAGSSMMEEGMEYAGWGGLVAWEWDGGLTLA
jgi:hypothetical protein